MLITQHVFRDMPDLRHREQSLRAKVRVLTVLLSTQVIDIFIIYTVYSYCKEFLCLHNLIYMCLFQLELLQKLIFISSFLTMPSPHEDNGRPHWLKKMKLVFKI